MASGDRDAASPNIESAGTSPTGHGPRLERFVDPGVEIPADLLAEHRAVLLRPGDRVAGRFEVIALLGFGGMGAVYHVKDLRLGLEKALKVMLPSLLSSATARRRFLSEIAISQQLREDHIVTVYDLAEDARRRIYFFTMEYIPGKTLHRLLAERGGRLSVEEAFSITRQLCLALAYAHRHTIHRDLKPQNIIVRPDGSIKVLDFGLAKIMSPGRLTRSSMALGTAYYQAPEQSVHLQELDQRADIYSIGVILYEMLMGKLPLGRFKAPSEELRVSKRVDSVLFRCLEPRAADRYPTVREFLADLESAMKKRRSKRWIPVAVLAILIAVGGGLVYAFYGPAISHRAVTVWGAVGAWVYDLEPLQEAAEQARDKAAAAGAADYAAGQYSEAERLLKEAAQLKAAHKPKQAAARYKTSAHIFLEAANQAQEIKADLEALETASAAMQTEKERARRAGGQEYAPEAYAEAVAEERLAASESDPGKAAEHCIEATRLFVAAAEAVDQYAQRSLAEEKAAAENVYAMVSSDPLVQKYFSEDAAEAEALLARADQEQNWTTGVRLYEEVVSHCRNLKVLSERQLADARASMEEAKAAAAAERARIGSDERSYAHAKVEEGEAAFAQAETMTDEPESAAKQYQMAEACYKEAIEKTRREKARRKGPLQLSAPSIALSEMNPDGHVRVFFGKSPARSQDIASAAIEGGFGWMFDVIRSRSGPSKITVRMKAERAEEGTYRLAVKAEGQTVRADVTVAAAGAPKPPIVLPSALRLDASYIEGTKFTYEVQEGPPDYMYRWSINGVETLSGMGATKFVTWFCDVGDCEIRLVMEKDGRQTEASGRTRIVAKKPNDLRVWVGYPFTIDKGLPPGYGDYRWVVDGAVVSRDRVLSHTVDVPGRYRIEGYAENPLSHSGRAPSVHAAYLTDAVVWEGAAF